MTFQPFCSPTYHFWPGPIAAGHHTSLNLLQMTDWFQAAKKHFEKTTKWFQGPTFQVCQYKIVLTKGVRGKICYSNKNIREKLIGLLGESLRTSIGTQKTSRRIWQVQSCGTLFASSATLLRMLAQWKAHQKERKTPWHPNHKIKPQFFQNNISYKENLVKRLFSCDRGAGSSGLGLTGKGNNGFRRLKRGSPLQINNVPKHTFKPSMDDLNRPQNS